MEHVKLSARVEAANETERTLSGRIVTFGEEGNTSAGRLIFEPGSLELPENPAEVRLQYEHDHTKPLGRGLEFTYAEENAGINGTFSVLATSLGNDALAEAKAELRNGLSVGVDIVDGYKDKKTGVYHVTAGKIIETSLVTFPAISSARVAEIAASEAEEENTQAEAPAEAQNESEKMENQENVEAAASIVDVPAPAFAKASMPSVGEFVRASALRRAEPELFARVTAALDEQVLAENPGIVPEPIVGPVVDTANAYRPLVAAFGVKAMPSVGKQYTRPVITQHTSVAAQASELTELSSQLMTIDPITVTKGTYGGALRLSVQDRDFTDPAILTLLINDMVKQYAKATDAKACTDLVAGVTQTETLAANAAADAVIAAIYGAAEQVIAGVNELPDLLIASPDQWARLGALVDTTKRPIFPSLAPVNAGGSMAANSFNANPLGLRLVVDANLTAGTLIVGRSEYYELHEQVGGQLSVDVPSILAADIAFYGYFATCMLDASAFVSLEPAA